MSLSQPMITHEQTYSSTALKIRAQITQNIPS